MAAAVFLCATASAFAGSQSMASGGGQTHGGATFGFNAKDAETGDFNYVGTTDFAVPVSGVTIPAGSRFQGHCFEYMHVNFVTSIQVRLFGQCRGMFWVDGGPPVRGIVYIQAHMTDKGEPGVNDRACIDFGLNRSPGTGDAGLFVDDCTHGTLVQSGNIQVNPS
jgi:hypothetical protein